MDFIFIILIFLIGFLGSFFSGMVGIGGAIVNYPLLLFLPPLFGFDSFSSYEISGMIAIQVLFATFIGFIEYRKSKYLNRSLIKNMGFSIFIGSIIGSFGSFFLGEEVIDSIYGMLAIIALVMLLAPSKTLETNIHSESTVRLAVLLSFFIGVGAGVVGAGGAFLVIPVLLIILRMPVRIAIANSMAITCISSIGTSFGKLSTGQVPFLPTFIIIIASLIAARFGVIIGRKINPKFLKLALSIFIIGTVVKLWWQLIF